MTSLDRVDTIVVVMLENRSFDHMLGHLSYGPYANGSDADGPCIIEPAVMCNHCGYCKSMGH